MAPDVEPPAPAPRRGIISPTPRCTLARRRSGRSPRSCTRGPLTPRDGTLLGQLFESLVTLDVRAYAQTAEASVGHLRTHGGEHEIDLIVEHGDHRVFAIDVKLVHTVRDDHVRHLRWLRDQPGGDVLDAIVVIRQAPTPTAERTASALCPQRCSYHDDRRGRRRRRRGPARCAPCTGAALVQGCRTTLNKQTETPRRRVPAGGARETTSTSARESDIAKPSDPAPGMRPPAATPQCAGRLGIERRRPHRLMAHGIA
ncbi:MAG: DUF4143 domain-containing protein [Actinomycetota bacterium]|nr:DUF4143 domain-containing protein [Actinomycetota bacterium]